ncbi:MAG: HAMP domain-containing histidine kinase [Sulfuricella sp.]|nr:HAMP domain-containing histidine kinase [Sulfuricella sp.]
MSELRFETVMATAVHEVKNMLGELSLNLSSYYREHPDEAVGKMHALSQVMQNRLIQILILQKGGSQNLSVDSQACNPGEFLDEAASEIQLLLPSGISLVVRNEAENVPFWFMDRYLVSQVLMNAVHNAGKFARSQIVLGCREEDGGLVFVARDDGPGYPDLPGYRPELASPDDKRGTGLGLLFSDHIAAAHGGQVRRRNADGAEFALWLPK